MTSEHRITFIATYEDGEELAFSIDKFTLRGGDHVARIIAAERQRTGELPPVKIVSVKRYITPSP